jgi:hypothetical protein
MTEEAKTKSKRKWTITLYLPGDVVFEYEHCTGFFQQFGIVSFRPENGLQISARCTYLAREEAREIE